MGRKKKGTALAETGGTTAVSWPWIVNILVLILKPIVNALTPIIREEIEKAVKAWYPKAVATPNPWDDFLVGFLAKILKIDVE
jgi:hypothetical protein